MTWATLLAFGVGFGVGIGTSQFARGPEGLEAGAGAGSPALAAAAPRDFAAAGPQTLADAAPQDVAAAVQEASRARDEPAPAADPAPDLQLVVTGPADSRTHAIAPATPSSATAEPMALPQPVPRVVTPWPRPLLDGLTRNAELAPEARPAKASLERAWDTEQVTVQRGDTLMDILNRAGIDQAAAHAAVRSLQTVYDPRRLRAGQELLITAAAASQEPAEARGLLGLAFDLSFDHKIRVTRRADGSYTTAKVERPQVRAIVQRLGAIDDSLYLAAERAEVPQDLIIGMIKLFSWDVDFQRDIRPGDRFETLFEEVSLEDAAATVRGGDLLYARLALSGRDLEAYRFVLPDGTVEYYDRTGKSVRKFLLRTPVDGARLSSRFGMRRHPILGYSRMHKGVDFAAPTGTPIYAAGSGKVAKAGRNGGYGTYIELRHNGEYRTAYAHLSRIAKGISPGRRVSQGQVIGYVGTTGRSTGPHLHYEILRNGTQINPLNVKQAALEQLKGADLDRFRQAMARIDRMRQDMADGTQVASKAH